MTNRTPTEVIASVEQWASHVLGPNDPMRHKVALVVAQARLKHWHDVQMVLARKGSFKEEYAEACERAFDAERAYYKAQSALSAAGVGGGE